MKPCATTGRLPLLTPMSEVAGRMSIQEGAKYLERPQMGRGILLGGVPGVAPAHITILGGGIVGANAAKVAAGFGADICLLDINMDRLRYLDDVMPANVDVLFSDRHTIREQLARADLVIGAVLIPGAKAPRLIERDDLKLMKPGSVIIDVAIDQGGCVATSRPTTHSEPTYIVDDVLHYCVTNMPGAVGRTSTYALCNVTLPWALADRQSRHRASGGRVDAGRPRRSTSWPAKSRTRPWPKRSACRAIERFECLNSVQSHGRLPQATRCRDAALGSAASTAICALIDQTLLPAELEHIDCRDGRDVWEAIKTLRVRGAPAIGIAAAYGVCVGLQTRRSTDEAAVLRAAGRGCRLPGDQPADGGESVLGAGADASARPSALRGKMPPREIADGAAGRSPRHPRRRPRRCAARSAGTAPRCCTTARACSRTATPAAWPRPTTARRWPCSSPRTKSGKQLHVYADETRPLLQGARLTAWELQQRGIDVTLICDSMAAQVMREGRVQAVVVGADRIAANGDTANKIGTYGVAVLAAAHDIPFYVAAPTSTFDLSIASGDANPDRTARPARNHARLRPADRARRASTSTTRPSTSRRPD